MQYRHHFITILDSVLNCHIQIDPEKAFELSNFLSKVIYTLLNILVSLKLCVVSSMAPENSLLSSAWLLWFSFSSLTSPRDKGHVSSEQHVSTVNYTLPWHIIGAQVFVKILLQRGKKK